MIHLIDPLFNGFMLGITTGPACFTSCVPVLLSASLSGPKGHTPHTTWIFLGKFLCGRFGAYLLFGVVMGLIGNYLGPVGPAVGSWSMVILSLVLMVNGFGLRAPRWGACRLAGNAVTRDYFPLMLGVLTGLNVCPPFLLAISYTLQRTISPLVGMLFFTSFFLATSLYVLPVGLAGYLPDHRLITRAGRGLSILVGTYFFYQGVAGLMPR